MKKTIFFAIPLLMATSLLAQRPEPIELPISREDTRENIDQSPKSPQEFSYFTIKMLETKAQSSRLTKEERKILKKARESLAWYSEKTEGRKSKKHSKKESKYARRSQTDQSFAEEDQRALLFSLSNQSLEKGWFSKKKTLDRIRILLRKNPSLFSACDTNKRTLLHHAVITNNHSVVKLLVASFIAKETADKLYHQKPVSGFDPNAIDIKYNTPLFYAITAGNEKIVTELLKIPSISINSLDKNRNTALHCIALSLKDASEKQKIALFNIAKKIIKHGASLSQKVASKTSRDIVASFRNKTLLQEWDDFEELQGRRSDSPELDQ